jgi:ferredoxin
MKMIRGFELLAMVLAAAPYLLPSASSFVVVPGGTNSIHPYRHFRQHPSVQSSTSVYVVQSDRQVLAVELEKPLGIVLEEVQEGEAEGVFVMDLAESGSAAASPFKDQLRGLTIATVMGIDVTKMIFDDVMDKIINAPSPVALEFVLPESSSNEPPELEIGTAVIITVAEDGKPDRALQAKVGDNLRQVLLQNNVEVYKGMKQKLGNCGGGGQCTFCAFDFVESASWVPRSDYEDQKLKKSPNARLTCLNNIQGPATIRK